MREFSAFKRFIDVTILAFHCVFYVKQHKVLFSFVPLFAVLSIIPGGGKKKKKDQGQHQVILSAFALQYVNHFFQSP